MTNVAVGKSQGQKTAAKEAWDEAYGTSQIGPFDYCPRLGFREYWYPGIWSKKVGKRRPTHLKMMGEELVLFRKRDGMVAALSDWCPHRGARLSRGFCDFAGTVTCPYHGYVFDETGQCVAGLIESTNSPLAPKMRAKHYPTNEWQGIVFVWMGETEPVPLEEDLPWEFTQNKLSGRRYTRVKIWETNWTEPMWQGVDFHEYYLHRMVKLLELSHFKLPFLRKKPVYTGGAEIAEEGDNFVTCRQKNIHYGQAEYPGLGKWPKHIWWRFLPKRTPMKGAESWAGYHHNLQLPSIARVNLGASSNLRWQTPVDDTNTRVWTFTICKTPRTIFGQIWKDVWYYLYRKWYGLVAINEREDFPELKNGNINANMPQKLGILDVGVIYFRRHLAKRARDYKRLGGAYGSQHPPKRTAADWGNLMQSVKHLD